MKNKSPKKMLSDPSTKLHDKSKEAMKKHLNKILMECKINKGFPDFGDDTFNYIYSNFWKEVEKTKKDWLSFRDTYSILSNEIRNYISKSVNSNVTVVSGNLFEIVKSKGIDLIAENIISFLESIPREYQIHFDLPAAHPLGISEIILTEHISLIEVEENAFAHDQEAPMAVALQGAGQEIKNKKLHICVKSSGYANNSLEDSAVKKAISIFKQFVLLGVLSGVLIKGEPKASSWGWGARRQVFIRDKDGKFPNEFPVDFLLPFFLATYDGLSLPKQVSDYVSSIQVNEETLRPSDIEKLLEKFVNADNLKPEEKAKMLKTRFIQPIKLLQAPASNPDAERIRTALEWSFDSITNDNDTFALIQACIGLEAILGEDQPQENLTERLADRCAYLLGKTFSGRRIYKEGFEKIYKIRSKLVHGRKPNLSQAEMVLLHLAKEILKDLIWKELFYLS